MPDEQTNNEAKFAWKEFVRSPMLLIFFSALLCLGFVVKVWVVDPLNKRIDNLEGQLKGWEDRRESWIVTKDQLQETIAELNRLVGNKQVLDSLKR